MKQYKFAGIYVITNTINNKRYVGYSETINRRWNIHKCRLRKNNSHCVHLQSAWNVYGEDNFEFSIIEYLSNGLSKQEYEAIETKWVLLYKTHLSEYGYNGVFPGSIPLSREKENVTSIHRGEIPKVIYICINKITKEITKCNGPKEVVDISGITINHVAQFASYWDKMEDDISHKGRKKSYKEWIVVKKDSYNPEFDYIGYKKSKGCKDGVKKTWRDYYHKERFRINSESVIPYEDRNLKRIPIVAVNIETGEEKQYRMIKACYNEFDRTKVNKCLSAPFGKYKHRGYYFRKL